MNKYIIVKYLYEYEMFTKDYCVCWRKYINILPTLNNKLFTTLQVGIKIEKTAVL